LIPKRIPSARASGFRKFHSAQRNIKYLGEGLKVVDPLARGFQRALE